MLLFRRYVGEDDATGYFVSRPIPCSPPQIVFAQLWELKEPQYGLGAVGEDT